MKKTIQNYIFLSLLLITSALTAQDAEQDIKRIQDQILGQSYAAQISQTWYPDHSSMQAVQMEEGEIKVQKDKACYRRIGDMETLFNEKYALTLNHHMKAMLIQPFDPKKGLRAMPDIKSMLVQYDKASMEILDENYAKYILDGGKASVEKVEITFHRNSFKLSKIAYYLRAGNIFMEGIEGAAARMEIEFKNLNFKPIFQPNEFSESRFVKKTERGFQARGSLSTYRLADYTG